MVRTQIQLPNALYSQAKRVAETHEISLAELVRRGLEHMVRLYRAEPSPHPAWRLPDPLSLGEFLVPVEDWREHANIAPGGDADSQ
jgi:hypothetical protein